MFFNWRLIFYPVPPGQLPLADIARLGQHPLADIAPPSRGSPPPHPTRRPINNNKNEISLLLLGSK